MTDLGRLTDYSHILVCGDFNLPSINWSDPSVPSTRENHTSLSFQFLESIKDSFLWQHVDQPTHHRGLQTANTLDLIFTNEENMIETLQYEAPIGKSHHSCIRFELKCYSDKARTKCSSLNFARADFDAMRQKISTLTASTLDHTDVNTAWEQISSTLASAINECIPKSTWDPDKPRRPMWIQGDLLKKIREKNAAHRRFSRSKSDEDNKAYCRKRNQTRWDTRKAKSAFERHLAANAKTNPKPVFKYINCRLKTRSQIPTLTSQGRTSATDSEKASMLNDFLALFSQRKPNQSRISPLRHHLGFFQTSPSSRIQ